MRMSTEAALDTAATILAPWGSAATRPEPTRLDVTIAREHLLDAVAALQRARWGYLSAMTGLDRPATGEFEVLYHFCAGAAIVTLRVHAPKADATVPSICGLIPSASFFERELSEMFGITVAGTPDPARLFLPDDWPEGVFPLRKDFGGERHA
jgi:Ni,Fe-hydrogenase III component G